MEATLTIQPLYNGHQTGQILSSTVATFRFDDPVSLDAAASGFGSSILDSIKESFAKDPELTAFDMTLEVKVEEEDHGRRAFIIDENVTHRVMATSQAEAEAIWIDKGPEAAEFIGVNERDIYEQGRND